MNTDKKKTARPFHMLTLSNPVYAYLELTYDCEGRCPGCPSAETAGKGAVLPGSRWTGIIEHLSPFLDEIRFTGGEPTVHPDFISILKSLKEKSLGFRIYTNGLWPDSAGLLQTLKENDSFRVFYVSLHGSTPSNHRFFTGLSDFKTILSNIEKAVSSGFPVYTVSVLGTFNRNDIHNIITLSAQLGARRHHFERYIGPVRDGISPNRNDMLHIHNTIQAIPPKVFSYRLGACFPRCFTDISTPCLAGITHITITPSGLIKGCPFSCDILGSFENNAIKGKKAIAAWTSDIPGACLACDEIGDCMGGCRALRRNFSFKRDPFMEEPIRIDSKGKKEEKKRPVIIDGYFKKICRVRKEAFGHILIREGTVIPITDRGLETLSLCDGTKKIGDIEREGGSEARDFILTLYLRGFLTLI